MHQAALSKMQHEEPLNCGQLVINSPHLAQTIYDARPDNFTNGAFSQQHYANVHKVKYTRTRRRVTPHLTPHIPHICR